MNIKKNDWIGIGASVVLHILLLVLFGAWSLRTPEPEALGYIEVEFGPFSEGRPVQRAAVDEPQAPEQPEVEPQPEQPEPEASPPEVARPVDAPDVAEEISDPERIQQPEAETIAPTQQDNPAEVVRPEPEPEPAPRPLGGGARDGTTGEAEGDAGEGRDEQRAAPIQIIGLNRDVVRRSIPEYVEKVNATIEVRITVNPQGRVIGVVPVRKANAALEREIERVLRNDWRFNPLPADVPQDNQTGRMIFRFRLD